LQLGLLLMTATAAGCVTVLPMPCWPPLWVLLVLACHQALRRHARCSHPESVAGIEIDAAGQWRATLRNGKIVPLTLLGSSTVTPWLTVLNLRKAGRWRARHVVILPDAIDATDFRRLRVCLRWGSVD